MIGSFSWRFAIVLIAMLLAGESPAADNPPPRRESMNALRDLTRQLTVEAQDAMREGFLRHPQPDAASRFTGRIGESELQKAISEWQHREPFVDAYIRWQLTSFEVALPEMTPQQFARFMEQAPAMVVNPRSSKQALDLFSRAADAGPLSSSDLAQLRDANRELDRQTQIAEALNTPATEFREWVARQLDGSARRLLWMLENCAALVQGAWMPTNVKRQISQSLSASATDASLTNDERAAIAQQAQRLAGLERRLVNEVTFMADGSVRVTLSTAAVTRRDVENWIERLAGER